ncbi:hypothetical protein V2J09_004997 [Rumex salicifolius]
MAKMGFNSDHGEKQRELNLNEFENSKAGVKGLVDAGITKVPEMFILPLEHQVKATNSAATSQLRVPTIDLEGFKSERRAQIIDEIGRVSHTWGIFYMVNHGVPLEVMKNMLEAMRSFHEQPNDTKMPFYSRDPTKKVQYYTSFQGVLNTYIWKDSLSCDLDDLASTELPVVCREAMCVYVKHMIILKDKLCALLSEALGLRSDHLESMKCMEVQRVFGHYYPACPEPDLTMGTTHHSDPFFLTILLTSSIDGLQVLYEDQWIDVPPMEGALICIIGDMLQLIANDLLKSAEHRVLARSIGPRLSVACFFYPGRRNRERKYGVIEELLSENNPFMYKEISFDDYFTHFRSKRVVGTKAVLHFRQ